MKRVCVFCGANQDVNPIYAKAARQLGQILAQRKIGLIYGGGQAGLMGVLAEAALAAGGEVIGVIPYFAAEKAPAHPGLSELRIVHSWSERSAVMACLVEAFIALPGDDTLAEFFEALTWSERGWRPKPWGLLNVAGYYDPLLALLARLDAKQCFGGRSMILAEQEVTKLLDRVARYRSQVIHEDGWKARGPQSGGEAWPVERLASVCSWVGGERGLPGSWR